MSTIVKTSFRTLLAGAALAAAVSAAPAAAENAAPMRQTVRAVPSGLVAAPVDTRSTPVPCNSVSACNTIIAYCAEQDGVWTEYAHNEQGQPSAGRCTLR